MIDLTKLVNYTNVMLHRVNGDIVMMQPTCVGHDTMLEAIECAEQGKPVVQLVKRTQEQVDKNVVIEYGIVETRVTLVETTSLEERATPKKETS